MISLGFREFCDQHNNITLCIPSHSSHLPQPLDAGCFPAETSLPPSNRGSGSELNQPRHKAGGSTWK
jgi:hypothetical protein